MNILPSPPTDNIYKFCAIIGAWLCTLSIAAIAFIVYTTMQHLDFSLQRSNNSLSKYYLQQIEKRTKSIEKGELSKNIIEWSPFKDGSENEINFLKVASRNHSESIRELDSKAVSDTDLVFKIIDNLGLKSCIPILAAFSFLLMLWGFKKWYNELQTKIDNGANIDLAIKDLNLKKIRLELVDIEQRAKREAEEADLDHKLKRLLIQKNEEELNNLILTKTLMNDLLVQDLNSKVLLAKKTELELSLLERSVFEETSISNSN